MPGSVGAHWGGGSLPAKHFRFDFCEFVNVDIHYSCCFKMDIAPDPCPYRHNKMRCKGLEAMLHLFAFFEQGGRAE